MLYCMPHCAYCFTAKYFYCATHNKQTAFDMPFMCTDRCPVCKNDTYLNQQMVLYLSPCFHKMCGNCLMRHYAKGSNTCPECDTVLRKVNYITSTFEDIEIERECKIRRQFNLYFNKEEEDFDNVTDYNEYLEEYENMIYELCSLKSESLLKQRIDELRKDQSFVLNKITNKAIEEVQKDTYKEIVDFYNVDHVCPIVKEYNASVHLPGHYADVNLGGGVCKNLIISYYLSLL